MFFEKDSEFARIQKYFYLTGQLLLLLLLSHFSRV